MKVVQVRLEYTCSCESPSAAQMTDMFELSAVLERGAKAGERRR